MCEPTTIMASLAVASTAVSQFGQYQQANAQLDVLEDQRRIQAEEISDQASQEMGERVKAARRERARARVAAGEAGVSGQSFEAMIGNSFTQQDMDLGAIAKGAEIKDRASQARYSSNVARVDRPTLLSSGLQIAQSGASGWQQGANIQQSFQALQIAGG